MFWGFCYCIQKFLPDRESNPGLPRDRRRSSPLDYRGHDAVIGPPQRKEQNCPVQTVQKSFEPDLNQRPMDVWYITTTVHRSTNWAIEGCMRVSHKSASIFIISNSVLELHTYQGLWLIHLLMLASKCQGGDVAQMVERSLSMWEVGGSIPPVSKLFFTKPFRGGGRSIHFIYNIYTYWSCHMKTKTLFASSGNRTRAARVAGEHSTTEPTMHMLKISWLCIIYMSSFEELFETRKMFSQSVGFEPTLPEGNWFLVSRLNHSATTAHVFLKITYQSMIQLLCAGNGQGFKPGIVNLNLTC